LDLTPEEMAATALYLPFRFDDPFGAFENGNGIRDFSKKLIAAQRRTYVPLTFGSWFKRKFGTLRTAAANPLTGCFSAPPLIA
jgi:hypothetical protein